MYMYVCIYIYIYIHIYTLTETFDEGLQPNRRPLPSEGPSLFAEQRCLTYIYI